MITKLYLYSFNGRVVLYLIKLIRYVWCLDLSPENQTHLLLAEGIPLGNLVRILYIIYMFFVANSF